MAKMNLTDEQLILIKKLIELGKCMADQIQRIMENHKLTDIPGNLFSIIVGNYSCDVSYGIDNYESGNIHLTKVKEENRYVPVGTNSPEYEILFATPELRERLLDILSRSETFNSRSLFTDGSIDDPSVDLRGNLKDGNSVAEP